MRIDDSSIPPLTALNAKRKLNEAEVSQVTESGLIASRDALIDQVKLPTDCVTGRSPMELGLMKSTVVDVNEALTTSGNAFRSAMADLVMLKANIGKGNWRAFLKSGVLNISEKRAEEWVNSYTKWIGTDEGALVKDHVLASMSSRTMSKLAGATSEIRNEALGIIMGGGKITEAEVTKMVSKKKSPRTIEQKALTDTLKDIANEDKKLSASWSNAAECQQEMKYLAEDYQKVVSLGQRLEKLWEELRTAKFVNKENELVVAYESHLKSQSSKNILNERVLDLMYMAKGLNTDKWNETAETAKKEFEKAQLKAAQEAEAKRKKEQEDAEEEFMKS